MGRGVGVGRTKLRDRSGCLSSGTARFACSCNSEEARSTIEQFLASLAVEPIDACHSPFLSDRLE